MAEEQKYTVLVGINFPPGDQRAEPGDVVALSRPVAKDLLAQGAVEPHEETLARLKQLEEDATAAAEAAQAAAASAEAEREKAHS